MFDSRDRGYKKNDRIEEQSGRGREVKHHNFSKTIGDNREKQKAHREKQHAQLLKQAETLKKLSSQEQLTKNELARHFLYNLDNTIRSACTYQPYDTSIATRSQEIAKEIFHAYPDLIDDFANPEKTDHELCKYIAPIANSERNALKQKDQNITNEILQLTDQIYKETTSQSSDYGAEMSSSHTERRDEHKMVQITQKDQILHETQYLFHANESQKPEIPVHDISNQPKSQRLIIDEHTVERYIRQNPIYTEMENDKLKDYDGLSLRNFAEKIEVESTMESIGRDSNINNEQTQSSAGDIVMEQLNQITTFRRNLNRENPQLQGRDSSMSSFSISRMDTQQDSTDKVSNSTYQVNSDTSTSRQDTKARRDQLLEELLRLSFGPSTAIKRAAADLRGYYSAKFNASKHFEKNKSHWEGCKNRIITTMSSADIHDSNYQKLKGIYDKLEALDTNRE